MQSINAQSYLDFEVIIVKGVSPQGRAINQGVQDSRGSIIIIVDDDSRLADDSVFERLVDCIDGDEAIGMAGASIVLPPEATSFQRRAARQFPRFDTPVVEQVTDSDMACHGCCALRKSVFLEVGGEREDILRGLDPDLRERLRGAGYRVVLSPNTRIHHPLPDGFIKLVRTFFRNGFGSAYSQKFQPDSIFDTSETLGVEKFKPRRSFAFRVWRFPLRLLAALVRMEELRFCAYIAYSIGYVWGMFTAREVVAPSEQSEGV